MANRLLKTIYITFHVSRASVRMRNEDLEKIFICIKEFIKRIDRFPMMQAWKIIFISSQHYLKIRHF